MTDGNLDRLVEDIGKPGRRIANLSGPVPRLRNSNGKKGKNTYNRQMNKMRRFFYGG